MFLVLIIMPIIVYVVIISLFPGIIDNPRLYPILLLLGSMYLLTMYLFFYVRFIDYYLDLWIVTNDRIIDTEQHNLFHRNITELDLFRIQDVTVETYGFFSTIFDYGNVIIKTASSNTNIIFYEVHHPNHIREELLRLSHEDRKYHTIQES